MTIVDSLNKRITFLHQLADELKLEDVAFVHARAEEFGQNTKYREQFEVLAILVLLLLVAEIVIVTIIDSMGKGKKEK